MRRGFSKGLRYTIDLSKIADRANPRTVEAPIYGGIQEPTIIEWGDGTSDTVTTGSFPTHTYADGTGNIFTVTLRSATGHLPDLTLSQSDQYNSTSPNANVTLAVVSVDHFAGSEGSNSGNVSVAQYKARFARNLKYCDPRFVSQTKWTSLSLAFRSAGIEQKLNSFCFDFCTQLRVAEAVFMLCTSLTGSIPEGLFDNNTLVTTFAGVFNNCSGLTGNIPEGLFDYNTSVTTFSNTFYGCSGLTGSIPSGLFDNNTLATSFLNTFNGCTGLTGSIPSGLFDNNTAVENFSGTFRSCVNIASIPAGLFDNNTNVETFAQMFYSTGITSIPAGLFDNNTMATTFTSTFYGCINLTEIPQGLFENNTAITNVQSLFHNCVNITTPYKFWNDDGTTKSQFASLTTTTNCYLGCVKMDLTQVPTAYGGTMTVS